MYSFSYLEPVCYSMCSSIVYNLMIVVDDIVLYNWNFLFEEAPHSSTLAWKIPWTEEAGGLQSMRLLRVDMTERLHFHFSLSCVGEGNSNTLQCSCLENPRDGGAWWAAIYGIAQNWTWLKRLSSNSSSSSVLTQEKEANMWSDKCVY